MTTEKLRTGNYIPVLNYIKEYKEIFWCLYKIQKNSQAIGNFYADSIVYLSIFC